VVRWEAEGEGRLEGRKKAVEGGGDWVLGGGCRSGAGGVEIGRVEGGGTVGLEKGAGLSGGYASAAASAGVSSKAAARRLAASLRGL
jgi:hypothetical protein